MADLADLAVWPIAEWRRLRARDVADNLAGAPTLAELAARLSALPPDTLAAVVKSDPAGYARTAQEAADAATYLRNLAGVLDATSVSLKGAAG